MRIVFFCLLLLTGSKLAAHPALADLDQLILYYDLDEKKNLLTVREVYVFSQKQEIPEWTRIWYAKPAMERYLLYQRLTNPKLEMDGKEMPLDVNDYGESRILLHYEGGLTAKTCTLSYQLSYPVYYKRLIIEPKFYDFPFSIRQMELHVRAPAGDQLKDHHLNINLDILKSDGSKEFKQLDKWELREGKKDEWMAVLDAARFDAEFFHEPVIHLDAELWGEPLAAPTTYATEWQLQAGWMIWLALAALILAIGLRFAPVPVKVQALRAWGLLILGLLVWFLADFISFFAAMADQDQAYGWENFMIELGVALMYLSIFGTLAWQINQQLSHYKKQAYYSVISFPLFILSFIPYFWVDPAVLLMLPICYAPLIFWFNKRTARYMGRYSYELVEFVETKGKVSFDTLQKEFKIPFPRLLQIIEAIPKNLVLVDHQRREFVAASAKQLQESFHICANCGSLTDIEQKEVTACGHCGTEYRQARKQAVRKPIPEIVRVAAANVGAFGYLFVILAGLFLMVVLVSNFMANTPKWAEDLLALLIIDGVLLYAAYSFVNSAKNLLLGKGKMVSNVLFLLLSPLVVPLFLFFKMNFNHRIRLFFNENELKELNDYIQERREAELEQVAIHLGVTKREALEIVHYLCANNRLDAVFDVSRNTVVSRETWVPLSGANSCAACGGLLGIEQGEVVCMYCGEKGGGDA